MFSNVIGLIIRYINRAWPKPSAPAKITPPCVRRVKRWITSSSVKRERGKGKKNMLHKRTGSLSGMKNARKYVYSRYGVCTLLI